MHATTVTIDLAKHLCALVFADGAGRILERKRLSYEAFSMCAANYPPLRVVTEACGRAHHSARVFQAQGIGSGFCRHVTSGLNDRHRFMIFIMARTRHSAHRKARYASAAVSCVSVQIEQQPTNGTYVESPCMNSHAL
jgi:hypothetical protein